MCIWYPSPKKKIRVSCELLEKVPSGKVQETIVLEKVKVEEGQEQAFQGPYPLSCSLLMFPIALFEDSGGFFLNGGSQFTGHFAHG